MLRTAESIIETLGDTGAVAALVGVRLSVVSNWKARKAIPPEYFLALSEALGKLKMVPDPAVFGMKEVAE